MKAKNPYKKQTRLGVVKTREIIHCFSVDLPAVKTAEILGLNRKTVDNWYLYIRKILYLECEKEKQEKLGGGVYELGESYFGPTRIKGKRGRGAGGKTIVFGLLKRGQQVYTEVIPDVKAKSLIPIIRGKIDGGSVLNTDGWRAYDGLVDLGFEKHFRVHHGKNEFARGK